MLMQSKNLASQSFEPISNYSTSAGCADRHPEPRQLQSVRRRVQAQHPLTGKALIRKHPREVFL